MDKIFINDLRIECIVGIWKWERQVRQTVIVDLEFAADISRAAATDRIEDAVDYKKLTERLTEFVGASQFNLIETLAEHTAQMLLREFGMQWLRLTVRKPGALPETRALGVTIERSAT